MSDVLISFMISFKYCLIFLRYFKLIVFYYRLYFYIQYDTPKTTYTNWFIIIFFFMLKKNPNISNYSVFNSFISFYSTKRFLISLIAASFVSFCNLFSLKRFFTSLIMFIFFKTWTFHHLMLSKKNNNYFLKKIKV